MAKLLLVVDYQNDFVDGALGFEAAKGLEKGITDKILEYSRNCEYIICTMDTHDNLYLSTQEGKKLPIPHCIRQTRSWDMYGTTKQAAYDAAAIMVEKNTFGAKNLVSELERVNSLEKRISGKGIDEIEVCGVVTNMCVISNAVIAKATLPEANIKILANLCSSFDMDAHNKALDVMKTMQMEVVEC